MDHPDDRAVGHRHERVRRALREPLGALGHVDGRFSRDPVAFGRHRGEQFRYRPCVARLRGPYQESGHRAMLAGGECPIGQCPI
jgi:hypothetical protein